MGVTTMDDINGVTDDPRDTEIFIAGMSYWTSHADLDTFNSDTLINSLVSMTPNHEPHLWSPNLAPCFDHFKRHVCTCNIPDCTVSIHIATDIGAYIEHSRNAKAYFNHTPEGATARIMVRQAESVFNLSQLMFALYHGQSRASTFRDLNAPDHRIVTDQPQQPQDRKLIHAGFDKIKGEQVLFFIEYNYTQPWRDNIKLLPRLNPSVLTLIEITRRAYTTNRDGHYTSFAARYSNQVASR